MYLVLQVGAGLWSLRSCLASATKHSAKDVFERSAKTAATGIGLAAATRGTSAALEAREIKSTKVEGNALTRRALPTATCVDVLPISAA